ncbi:hypothetical protein SCB49_11037 [unidentified eubacterium SCB49]|nr:hypothetical protein SCB49_11037 [unidentified eubacterium SCB49]
MKQNLTTKQKELIERFGVIQEGMGLSPASARVNALLVVADSEALTFDYVREALDLSKSATSNAINTLLMMGQVGYKTKPGDRKRYFYSKLGEWQNSFRDRMNALTPYKEIINEIYENRTVETENFNIELKEFAAFIEYYQEESLKLINNWKK